MEETKFENYTDYVQWFYEYTDKKAEEIARQYDNVTKDDVLEFLRTRNGQPKGFVYPSKMMNTIFDNHNELNVGLSVDLQEHTKEEGERLIDEMFEKPSWYIGEASKYRDKYPDDSIDDICFDQDIYGTYKPKEKEIIVETIPMTVPEEEPKEEIEIDENIDKKYLDPNYKAEVPKEYNWNQIDMFNSQVGKIVTGDEWAFAPLNNMFINAYGIDSDNFDVDKFDELDKEIIKNTDWTKKTDEMLQDANNIINGLDEFILNIDDIGGEFGEIVTENLNLTSDDLNSLKNYLQENLSKVTYFVEELKQNLIKKEEVEKELEKRQEEETTKYNPPEPEIVRCQHKNSDDGSLLHPGGDPNPKYASWKALCTIIENLNKELEMLKKAILICLKNIKVYDSVRVKYIAASRK